MDQKVEEKLEENLEYAAAKQFFAELSQIKNSVYQNRGPMNSLLLMGIRRTVAGMLTRYQQAGLLKGESIKTMVSDYSRQGSIVFQMSDGLKAHLALFIETNKEQMQKIAEEKRNERKQQLEAEAS